MTIAICESIGFRLLSVQTLNFLSIVAAQAPERRSGLGVLGGEWLSRPVRPTETDISLAFSLWASVRKQSKGLGRCMKPTIQPLAHDLL